VFGVVDNMLSSCVCLAVAGAADMVSGVSRNAMLLLSASPELQGRIQGVGMAVWTSGPQLGDAEAGGVAAITSLDTSIWLGGLACVAGIGVIAVVFPEFTRFRADAAADSRPAGAAAPVPDAVVPAPTE
jgi:hypothetical protein